MSVLKGKVALVTGGSRGIGAAIVRRLAAEGAQVAFTYVSSKEKADEIINELTGKGYKALAIRADSSLKADLEAAVEKTVENFGRLDIVVNSAGIIVIGAIEDSEKLTEQYDKQIDINMRAVATLIRKASAYMQAGGRIINIGSVAGTAVGIQTLTEYGATKAAAAAYTRGFAWDLGSKGITVNSIQPGPIATDMNPEDTDLAEHLRNKNALKRFGKPEEVAALVNFLAGPEAGFITGAVFNIDGGSLA